MFISHSDLPGYSNLFLDYIYEFENVKDFYPRNFREEESYKETLAELQNGGYHNRGKIASIIESQYYGEAISKQTSRNIDLLRKNNTAAIVTGQQVGIFGGPLYSFYKIITAIKLARSLGERFTDFHFVPVFWLETDDHDFDEVKSVSIINKENRLKTLTYDDGLPAEINRGSVGGIRFTHNLDDLFAELDSSFRETEFKKETFDLLKNCYSDGKTFAESFKLLLMKFFDDEGLIVFNPADKNVKNLLKPIFGKELELFSKHTNLILDRTAEIEEKYQAQVKVKPINLFFNAGDGRYLIEPAGAGLYRLKSKRTKMELEKLLDYLEETPGKFSPNVLLRPICQDFLFPTAAYVAGPGEISYFAQVNILYEIYEITPPVIYPRASVSLLEKHAKNVFEKYNISFFDLYIEDRILRNKVVKNISDSNLQLLFDEFNSSISRSFSILKKELALVDEQLNPLTDKTSQNVFKSIERLKLRTEKSAERKYETALRQLEKTKLSLFPGDIIQERQLNFTYFAVKYGLDVFKWIFDEIKINKFEHQIIDL